MPHGGRRLRLPRSKLQQNFARRWKATPRVRTAGGYGEFHGVRETRTYAVIEEVEKKAKEKKGKSRKTKEVEPPV